jgi:hypothetical protein
MTSFGYHGQDGSISNQPILSQPYGPSYISGDIIGCCVNFANSTAFFTKNGVALGTAFKEISNEAYYYPCVGLSTQGERISANFGQEPFAFDIVQYIKVHCIVLLFIQNFTKDFFFFFFFFFLLRTSN